MECFVEGPQDCLIPLGSLTGKAFAPFGTVIENHLPSLRPQDCKGSSDQELPSNVSIANQETALKYGNVSTVDGCYHLAPSKTPPRTVMNLFACQPRQLRSENGRSMPPTTRRVSPLGNHDPVHGASSFYGAMPDSDSYLDIPVMERHPYTSQTFIPLHSDPLSFDTYYVVIVAPTERPNGMEGGAEKTTAPDSSCSSSGTLTARIPIRSLSQLSCPQTVDRRSLPDLRHIRAFRAKPSQAVTYGPATWHAPMAVVGSKPMDFVVVQQANGVADEDCQEVFLGSIGTQQQVKVSVDFSWVPRNTNGERKDIEGHDDGDGDNGAHVDIRGDKYSEIGQPPRKSRPKRVSKLV